MPLATLADFIFLTFYYEIRLPIIALSNVVSETPPLSPQVPVSFGRSYDYMLNNNIYQVLRTRVFQDELASFMGSIYS